MRVVQKSSKRLINFLLINQVQEFVTLSKLGKTNYEVQKTKKATQIHR